ncbi:hypothetical protein BH24DEI2_BH24DEI2_26610 [soil metagenome]
MNVKQSSSTKIIVASESADLLVNLYTLRQLAPFLGRDCTVTRAAQETGTKPNTVLSRVRRFVKLGLLQVVREEQRKGRAVKVYRSTADVFFVPFETTSAETLETMLQERDAYWETLLRRGVGRARAEDVGTWGTRVYRDAADRLQVQTAVTPTRNYTLLDPDRPAVLSAWRDSVYLDFSDAKALQREMFDLLKRYHQKAGAQRYIVRLGMAPLEATPEPMPPEPV